MPTKGSKRPANEAKEIIESVKITVVSGIPTYNFTPDQRNRVWQLVHDMDASTGKPDSARKRRRASAAKKTGR